MTHRDQRIPASNALRRPGGTVSASEGPATTPAQPYDGVPWRILCLLGDSNMGGPADGYQLLDKAVYPPPSRAAASIWDQAGHPEGDVLNTEYDNHIRTLTEGYAGGIDEPWINGGYGIGPEFGIAAELNTTTKKIRTLIVKMGLGGSYAYLGAGWNWNKDMTGPGAALSRFYNEHYVPALAALVALTGDISHIEQTCIASLIGGNDMFPAARSTTYAANMPALILELQTLIKPSKPNQVPWCIIKQPLYESPLGTPFGDIVGIRATQDALHDPVTTGVTTLDIGQPTPGVGELHWDVAGQYTVGRSVGVWLKSVVL